MKTTRRVLLAAALAGAPLADALLAAASSAASAAPEGTTPMPSDPAAAAAAALKNLKPGHPRLIVTEADIARLKGLIQTDATAKRNYDSLRATATAMLETQPVEYVLIGPRLLDKSRTALDRIWTLSTLFLLDGDRKWRDRAVKEMLAVSAFPDWHPQHFLDTGEMTNGVAIGYDWLYGTLSPEEKTTIRAALVKHGLGAGVKAYKGKETYSWWVKATNNWNQVCNGGLVNGALAIADEEPELARYVLTEALKSLPGAMASFAPDGGWEEGPGYWGYTARYCITMFAAMRTAVGTDFGLPTASGFDRTGTFRLYSVGPNKRVFNWADGSASQERAPEMRWLARRFDQPLYDWVAEDSYDKAALPLDLIWYHPTTVTPATAHAPLDNVFRRINVAYFRSAWNDRQALWVGFKGGDNAWPHAHLDLGNFCFEALGERWALTLGSDNYNLPGYFQKERWNYYRMGTWGQNVPLLDDKNQALDAKSAMIAYGSVPDRAWAVVDLTEGYKNFGARKFRRGLSLTAGRKALLVLDEWELAKPAQVQWQMHTPAEIAPAPDGRSAALTRSGKKLNVYLVDAPAGARLAEESAAPPPLNGGEGPQQNPNRGIRRLVVRLPEKAAAGRVAVLLSPGEGGPTTVPCPPLDEWIKEAPPLPALGGVL